MDKFNSILKNVLIFLVIFLLVNYALQSCQKEKEISSGAGNFVFSTTDTEYSRTKPIILDIQNNTDQAIALPNDCPDEPFDVYRYENNEWVKQSYEPDLDCESAVSSTLAPGEKTQISYEHWKYGLFGELGRFRIEFTTEVNGEEKIFQSNEFIVKEEGIFSKLWNGIFYKPIYNGLIFLTKIMPAHDLGLAIILLTIIIRTILLIPSQKALRAQRKLQDVQPRLEKIREKYKGDQQRIAMETMAIWKENKVNPFGSCLPMLLQLPFLIAIFHVVQNGTNPDSAYLLYTSYSNFNLSDIQTNFFGILELTKNNLYVLPLLIGGLQFTQIKLTMARREKKENKKDSQPNEMAMANNMMMYFMPVMIAVFTASLPAGVGLYWGTSTIYGIFQQIIVNRSTGSDSKEPTVKVISKN